MPSPKQRETGGELTGWDTSGPTFYLPRLDVLRLVAFLMVFAHHLLPQDPATYANSAGAWLAAASRAGAYGVDLFFALSAFLITEILRREQALRGRIDLRAFYLRRILRIWPLYYAFLAAAAVLVPHVLPGDRLDYVFLSAFCLLAGNWACALLGYPPSVASPLWSVSIEEQFYLLWPVAMRLRSQALLVLTLSFFGVATIARLALLFLNASHPAIWCATLSRLDPIAAGALLALLLRGRRPTLGRAAVWSALGAAGTVFLLVGRVYEFRGPLVLLALPLVAAASAAAVFAMLAPSPRVQAQDLLVRLGRMTYGLYVFHVLGLALAHRFVRVGSPSMNLLLQGTAGLGITLALAAVSYRWLEQPFLRKKERLAHVATTACSH